MAPKDSVQCRTVLRLWLCIMQVVPDKIGDKYSTYNDFICALPDGQCRYAGTIRRDDSSSSRDGQCKKFPSACYCQIPAGDLQCTRL
jgi:hypothetical protein